jgi:hypothetical protein
VLEESALCSAIAGLTAKEALASMPIPTSLAPEEDLRRVHSELRRCGCWRNASCMGSWSSSRRPVDCTLFPRLFFDVLRPCEGSSSDSVSELDLSFDSGTVP